MWREHKNSQPSETNHNLKTPNAEMRPQLNKTRRHEMHANHEQEPRKRAAAKRPAKPSMSAHNIIKFSSIYFYAFCRSHPKGLHIAVS